MKIEINSTHGNFDYTVDVFANIKGEHADAILKLAALQFLQRQPAGDAEKEMAVALGLWPDVNKKGEPVRPKGFQRTAIPYSEASAEVLKRHLTTSDDEAKPRGFTTVCTSVVEHVVEEADSKFTEEIAIYRRHRDELKDVASWLAGKIRYSGPVEGDGPDGLAIEMLRAIRTVKLAAMRIAAAV